MIAFSTRLRNILDESAAAAAYMERRFSSFASFMARAVPPRGGRRGFPSRRR
jgi:hypothetical protein